MKKKLTKNEKMLLKRILQLRQISLTEIDDEVSIEILERETTSINLQVPHSELTRLFHSI